MRVLFRTDKSGEQKGVVTAVFVDSGYTKNSLSMPGETIKVMESYSHIDQHSECGHGWVLAQTRPATTKEYGPLLKELERVGYDGLQIMYRLPRKVD